MAYSFDQIFAADPSNPANVAGNASVLIYEPGDASKAPLTITDTSGSPLPNPINVNANGFASAFMHETLDRVAWDGGGFSGYFTSYEGIKNEAVAARDAAESAASTAATEATAIAEAAIAGATDEATAAATAAATSATAATASATAAANAAALVGAPADSAIAAAVNNGASATKVALNANYAGKSVETSKLDKTEAAATYATVPAALAPRERPKRITGQIVVTAMQPGHGWSITSGTVASSNMNDTTDFTLGNQAATLTTVNGGAVAHLGSTNPTTVVNATGKALRIWVKVSDTTKVSELSFWAASGGTYNTCYRWDVQAYGGSIEFIQPNQWTPLTLHFGNANITGAPDRSALNRFKFQIKDKGTGAVSFGFNGLETIPDSSAAYPNGVISITFDDTWISQYTLAKPLMDKYGYQGTAYIITGNVGTAGRMSLAQLKQLQLQGWEIATHAATQAIHDGNYGALSTAMITAELQAAKTWLAENGFRGGDHFAYPGGHCENNAGPTAQLYFTSARLVNGQNAETLPPADPNRIRSMQPSSGTSVAAIQAQIDAVVAAKAWLPLSFHVLVPSGATGGIEYNTTDFDTVLAYAQSKGVAVRTVGQALRGE